MQVAHWAQITLSFSVAPLSVALTVPRASFWWPLCVDSYLTGKNVLVSNLLMGLVSSAFLLQLCWVELSPCPRLGTLKVAPLFLQSMLLHPVSFSSLCRTLEGQTSILPSHTLTPVAERVCSILPVCSRQHRDTPCARFCAFLLQSAFSSQPASFSRET